MLKVFYSFHYDNDSWRAAQIRNIGVIEGNEPLDSNDWEEIKRGGDQAIKNWIDSQLEKCDCLVVLIGEETSNRPWVKYEIEKAWDMGLGVTGIYIHNLRDSNQNQSLRGENPLFYAVDKNGTSISRYTETHDPSGFNSKVVYANIKEYIETWVEEAILTRKTQRYL